GIRDDLVTGVQTCALPISLMARVRAGAKVIIENGARPVAVLHTAEPVRRSISECIALAKAHEEETGKASSIQTSRKTLKKFSAKIGRASCRERGERSVWVR